LTKLEKREEKKKRKKKKENKLIHSWTLDMFSWSGSLLVEKGAADADTCVVYTIGLDPQWLIVFTLAFLI
jgi:hypothetical protein